MKKVRGITLSLVLLGSLFLIGPLNVSAEGIESDNELFALPTDISMTPTEVVEWVEEKTVDFTVYYGGGTGTYNWTFNYDDGSPTLYGQTTYTSNSFSNTYRSFNSQNKSNWYPTATVTSTNTASTSAIIDLAPAGWTQ
jgi:hypothetical protein